MELDSFLASPRWDILRIIIEKPSSPMEIALEINTTISFVSQQLKLLEAAGIVKKQRTGLVDKGKPRSLFSISKESLYMIPLTKGMSEKKLIPLSTEQKIILKIWELNNSNFQILLEKFFWTIQEYLSSIDEILISIKGKKCKTYVVSTSKDITHKINEVKINPDEGITFQVTASSSLPRSENEDLVSIYHSQETLGNEQQLKGGLKVK